MPCYQCGARQGDPEPGKPSAWRQGVVVAQPPAGERQVLICPDCYPQARLELVHCSRCDGVRLVKRLDQVECLGCRLTRDAPPPDPTPPPGAAPPPGTAPPTPRATPAESAPGAPAGTSDPVGTPIPAAPSASPATDSTLAAEVAAALDRILRDK